MPVQTVGGYNGLAVALLGENYLRAQTTLDQLTLEHSSANEGNFLVLRNFVAGNFTTNPIVDTTIVTNDLVRFDGLGGIQTVVADAIKMELNSSGLYAGTTQIVSTLGSVFGRIAGQRLINTVATTGTTLVAADSGSLTIISSGQTTCLVRLPASAISVGDYFEVLQNSTAAADVNVYVPGTTGPLMYGHMNSTNSIVTTLAAVTHESSGIFWFGFTVISTTLPEYVFTNLMAKNGVTTGAFYQADVGTTST